MNKPRSNCCNAPMTVGGEGTTHWYICQTCGHACDIATDNKQFSGYSTENKECVCYKTHPKRPYNCGCPCHDGTKDDVQTAKVKDDEVYKLWGIFTDEGKLLFTDKEACIYESYAIALKEKGSHNIKPIFLSIKTPTNNGLVPLDKEELYEIEDCLMHYIDDGKDIQRIMHLISKLGRKEVPTVEEIYDVLMIPLAAPQSYAEWKIFSRTKALAIHNLLTKDSQ